MKSAATGRETNPIPQPDLSISTYKRYDLKNQSIRTMAFREMRKNLLGLSRSSRAFNEGSIHLKDSGGSMRQRRVLAQHCLLHENHSIAQILCQKEGGSGLEK